MGSVVGEPVVAIDLRLTGLVGPCRLHRRGMAWQEWAGGERGSHHRGRTYDVLGQVAHLCAGCRVLGGALLSEPLVARLQAAPLGRVARKRNREGDEWRMY